MNQLGVINLFAFIVLGAMSMMFVRTVRGIMMVIVAGWLTLSPRAGMVVSGLPELTKDFAVSYAVAIGMVLFRSDMIRGFKPKGIDALAAIWIASPFISSLTNGLGLWDACSELYGRFFFWGVPYLVGRIAIRSLDDVRLCAIGLIMSGVIAAPLCLLEIRLSPQLHRWVYGVHQTAFHMTMRLGGYRPMLMFRHGIEVGTWMACASVVAGWFALTNRRLKLVSVPIVPHALFLLLVTLICRSLGSIALLIGSCSAGLVFRSSRLKIVLVALILSTPTYLVLRVTGMWSPEGIVEFVAEHIDAERAESMDARVTQEMELGERASKRPFFGWGGHNRFRVFDDYGEATTAVDALWLISYGKNGITGLLGLYGMLCIPALLILRRVPARLLLHPNMAGVVALILALAIATGDSLQNAFFSPLMMVGAGALATTAVSLRSWLPRPQPPMPAPRSSP